jgi:hypothetical protein
MASKMANSKMKSGSKLNDGGIQNKGNPASKPSYLQ